MRAVIFGYFGTLTDPGAEEYREPLAHRTGELLGGCRPRFWEALAGSFGERSASLYGYVSSKDEMYDLMVDWVDGEDGPPPAPSGNLRSDLFGLAHRIRRSILRHPWMTSVAAGRPNFGPNSLAWHEYGLAVMDDRGLTIDEMLVANEILQSFVRGFTTRELAEQQALQRAGLDADAWGRAMRPYTEAIEKSGRYPRFTRVVRDAHLPHAPDRQELIFSSGLNYILDSPHTRHTVGHALSGRASAEPDANSATPRRRWRGPQPGLTRVRMPAAERGAVGFK
jgi:hypothetical protein